MEWAEITLQRLAAKLSQMMDPVVLGLERLRLALRQQMDQVGVPYDWQGPILTAAWVLVLFMVVRSVSGWLRLLAIGVAMLVLAKVYGFLPGG